MEKWDILDRQGKKTGKTVVRGFYKLGHNEYHLVVHIWIYNDKGEFLIQKRSLTRPLMAGEWAATGGSAVAGEKSRTAAYRELLEELGIKVNPVDLILEKRMFRKNSINDIWSAKVNIPVERLTLQKEEVADAKWVSEETLRKMVKSGEFHNYGDEYFDIIYRIPFVKGKRK